jgi:hypothetical protein
MTDNTPKRAAMSWEDLFVSFVSARQSNHREEVARYVQQARRQLATNTNDDWKMLANALQDHDRKWFVAEVFSKAPIPKRLFSAFVRAAIYEVNPSHNRYFVEPCVASYGHRKVNEALLDYVENGSPFEIAGAVVALYWAQMRIWFSGTPQEFTLEYATPESRKAYLELQDVWNRKRCLFLRMFVTNENLDVRRNILPSLTLEETAYPDDLGPLVAQAIEIARRHPDDYLRHRVEVQLGNERLYKPMPHRGSVDHEADEHPAS